MKILHITDFHYSEKGKDSSKIISEICNKISVEKGLIDFIFFTGDLVNMGGDTAPYKQAKELLFDQLSKTLNVPQENIIICPGNHDIDRTKISRAIKSYIEEEINGSTDKLNNFYKDKTNVDYISSINPSVPFYKFIQSYYNDRTNNIISQLYTIHYRHNNDKKIGIVCINTAWMSAIYKELDDKGKLLIPPILLDEAINQVKNCDQKIILMHHPLYFLQDFNLHEVEQIIHSEFNLMFSGHVHKISSLSRYNGSNGIFEHVAKASLSHKENIGCSLIEVDDVEENRITVREITYIEDSNECHISEDIIYTIPCGAEKTEILSFRKKIYDKISSERENANNLLLLKNDESNNDFITLYNHPVLKKESTDSNLESKNTPIISLDDLIASDTNYLILGKDKCGKTSLLKRLQIEYLINFSRNNRIPFYIDAKLYENSIDDKFSIEQLIRSYYDCNRGKVKNMLFSPNFILLIDNYTPNSAFAEYLDRFLKIYSDIRFIICSEHNLSRTVDMIPLGDTVYDKIFFHELRRQEIVSYTEKRLAANAKLEDIQQKIIQLCKQLELPLNYWTISLLLLIHNKSSDSYAKNLFSILDICIDEIFDKKQLLLSRSKISHEQLKKICAELAKYLFINHSSTVYSASEIEILDSIENTIRDNDRIAVTKENILEYLKACGIIKEKHEDQRFVFRLNGFFEYFLAYQMTKDETFRKQVLEDEQQFIAFKNQIEIYSGFKRDDYEFLKTIFDKVHFKLNPVFSKYAPDKDKELCNKVQSKREVEAFCKEISIKRTLSSMEKAKLEDDTSELDFNSEVHPMESIDTNIINAELVERYLSILSRTFRSADDISGHKEEIDYIFEYIINSYCDLGFYLVEEFEKLAKNEFKSETNSDIQNFPELDLLNFISSFTPLICQIWLFDGVGHYNLERKIKNKIEQLIIEYPIKEYKLFILCFLLLDIDLSSNKGYIEVIMKHIKIPVLKYAIIIKLNYYLAFRGGKDKSFQQQLSNHIQKARLNLDNTTNISDIHRQIQQKKKESLYHKQ